MKQALIPQFFKPRRPSQTLMTDYLKRQPITLRRLKKKKDNYHSRLDYRRVKRYLEKHKAAYDVAQTNRGYFFCISNDFKEYHVYTAMEKLVQKSGKEVLISSGTRLATAMIDENSALEHISVIACFRRRGIGKKLITFINKHAPQFHVFGGTEHNSRYRLTAEGAALIQACEKAGILRSDQIVIGDVPLSPSHLSRSIS